MKLSEHFSLSEMTITSNIGLQEQNHAEAKAFITPLTAVAESLERLRAYLGAPIVVHSAFRCSDLNGATPGSSPKSQHMKGEAVDFSCPSKFSENDDGNTELFQAVKNYLATHDMPFGQLIDEGCNRPYGRVVWIHFSLGSPFRETSKCGQLLKMRDGAFNLLGTMPQP